MACNFSGTDRPQDEEPAGTVTLDDEAQEAVIQEMEARARDRAQMAGPSGS